MPLNLLITFENNSLTLDHPGDDYSAGGTTLTAIGSPTMPTTQPFAGLRSGYLPNPSQYWYMPSAGIFSIADGSYAFSFYHDAVWPTSEAFNFREIADVSNHLLGRFTGADGTGGFEVNIRVGAFGQITISTGDLGLGIGAYYSCKVEWDEAATTIRIKIYDAVGTQIGSTTVNTSVTAGAWPSTIDRLIFGDASGVNGDWYLDNILLGSTASDPLEDNLDIETYGDYGAAGARITAVDSPVLDAEVNSGVTTTGFGSAINSITIETAAGVNEIDLSASIAGSAGSWTYDMPSIYNTAVNLAGTPMDSASYTHTITLGDGTDTDSEVIVVNPTTGWLVRELVSPVKTAGSAFENFIGIPISGDQCLYPTANITSVAADGILTTDQISGTISMVFWDSTGEMALNGLFNVDDYWTYPPATWRITGGGAEHYANGSGDIYQTPEIDIVAGGTYEFTLIVSGYTAGTATIGLVGGIAVNGTARSANGTFVESLVAVTGNNLIRVASNVTGRFTIDSISVKRTDVPSGIYKPFTITIGAGGATYSKSRFGMMNSFGKFG